MKRLLFWLSIAAYVAAYVALCLILCSCAGHTVFKPVNVEVPVNQPCAAKPPAPPIWPTLALKRDAGIIERVKALAAENELRKGYEKELHAAFDACIF